MKRCASFKSVPAVRGQTDEKGKPIIVKVPCNLPTGHGGQHGNELNFKDGSPVVIRGGWT